MSAIVAADRAFPAAIAALKLGLDTNVAASQMMKQKTLDILDRLTRAGTTKVDRLTELLRDPELDLTPGWFMHVPKCFNDALDIKQTTRVVDRKPTTVWTQGAAFAFKTGDLLYDSERACEEWSQAIRHIGVAVQVGSATDAAPPQPGIARTPGAVTFDVLLPSPDHTQLVPSVCLTLTQDEFVRLLITGDGLPLKRV